jgi:hypothetical protein
MSRLGCLLCCLLLVGPSHAEGRPVFVAQVADGKPRRGFVTSLDRDGTLRLETPRETVVAGGELLSLRRFDRDLPSMPEDLHVVLVNGDRFAVGSPRLVGERFFFRHPDLNGGAEAVLPLGALALIWREPPVAVADPEALRHRLLAEKRSRDVVLLGNGDRVEGSLSALDGHKIELEGDRKNTLELRQTAALALSTEYTQPLRPSGVYARLTLYGKDGGPGLRLSLMTAACDGSVLTGTTLFGATLQVPLERVAALDFYQGRAVYLSDLKPTSYEYKPYLDEKWPLGVDATADGRDLRLGGSTYARGLGMHSRSSVTYRLDGAYRRFEAVAGMDARMGREGTARVRVLADGKPMTLPNDGVLIGGREPLRIGVGVEGVKELTLEVDYLRRGLVQGNVNWVDARLIRDNPPR